MLLIDTDNAVGSPAGDVDDAFAIAALLRSGLPVAAVWRASRGNTSEARADRNNRGLGELCGYGGPTCEARAGDVPDRIDLWSPAPLRFLALGPLTNLAALLDRVRRSPRWSSSAATSPRGGASPPGGRTSST